VVLAARGAHAEVPATAATPGRLERIRPWQIAVGASGSAVPGSVGQPGRSGFGLFAGGFYSTAAVGDATRPFVGLGVDLCLCSAIRSVREGGLVDEKSSVQAWTLGPQARIGVAFGPRDELTSLYLSVMPFYADTGRPAPWATEDGGTWAFRTLVGVSLLDSWPLVPHALPSGPCDGGLCGISLFLLLLPTTLELGYERIRDENRGAVFLGYTL
jgi:hypothetical protein